MSIRLHLGAAGIALAAACATGCATSRETGQSSWLNLPSPLATVKASQGRNSSLRGDQVAKPAAPAKVSKGVAEKSNRAAADSITMALLRGRNFERSGDYAKAQKLYEELYERHPGHPQIAHRLGVVADTQRRHAEAEQFFQIALQHEPRNAEVLADLGYCYFLQGQLTKAQSALTKAVLLEPDNARNRNNLGLVLGHMGEHDEALEHFRKAGSEADACYNLAFIFAAQDQVAEAKECFQMALSADPTHRAAREALASFGDYEDMPEHMQGTDSLAESGERWVPFVEGDDDGSGVAQAGGASVTSRDASRVTRALHLESRGMLNRNMQSQRNDEPAQ